MRLILEVVLHLNIVITELLSVRAPTLPKTGGQGPWGGGGGGGGGGGQGQSPRGGEWSLILYHSVEPCSTHLP